MDLTSNNGETGKLAVTDKRIADYAMVLDLLGSLTELTSEKVVIESIIGLFRSLCAPSVVIYIPVIDDLPVEAIVFPVTLDAKPLVKDIIGNFHDDYSMKESGSGFRLRIKYGEKLLCFIEVEGIAFPEYNYHYLNLSLHIVNVLALSIHNARTYESFRREINERKQLEIELKEKTIQMEELNRSLEQKVRKEIDARRHKDQLLIQQSKMAAMGEMIGAIAHQWKQPLNSLSLLILDVKDAYEFGELDAGYLYTFVERSMKEISFMAKTVDDFRNFFKPSREKETFDLIEITSEVFSMLSSQFNTNDITYRITCRVHNRTFFSYNDVIPCEATQITTYKNQLAHVILNIINNAKDAIIDRRQKGLLGALEKGVIWVDCDKKDNVLRLEIGDNGGGVADGVKDRIFESYFTTKTEDKGTGIGLYMSKIIVEDKLGGKIHLRNVDNGSVFTLELSV
ncbi:MAG: hypothetical protein HQK89_18115 [Nitrospirae bacterium]|nr:hypothetical protein [Nitrospirota bacterium]